jgi:AcrR family transcriptional regulator
MTLFIERGYDDVTVADIAERAGLTKRSFFNHFADKPEVMFASADALQASVQAAPVRDYDGTVVASIGCICHAERVSLKKLTEDVPAGTGARWAPVLLLGGPRQSDLVAR